MQVEDCQPLGFPNFSSSSARGSMYQSRDSERRSQHEEKPQFQRPAITTGAKLPWNHMSSKPMYWPPAAFSGQVSQPTKPAITILSNKQETTKLVYSREADVSTSLQRQETPFKSQSQLRLSDEEDQGEMDAFKVSSSLQDQDPPSQRPQTLPPIGSKSVLNNGQNCSTVTLAEACPSTVVQTCGQGIPDCQPFKLSLKSTGMSPPQDSLATSAASFWPSTEGDSSPNGPSTIEIKNELSTSTALLIEPSHMVSNISTVQKPSVASSQLRPGDIGLDLSIDGQDQVCPSGVSPEGNSRSQSLEDVKRKAQVLEPLQAAGAADENGPLDLTFPSFDMRASNDIVLLDQRASKRRMTSRASALKATDKKLQETRTHEQTVQKLQIEHEELQEKYKLQTELCNDLRANLTAAQENLRLQEELNAKMKAEMQFLRTNLASNFPGNSLRAQHQGSVAYPLPEQNWMDAFSNPQLDMPTHDEIAAEFGMDCPLIPAPSQLIPEWQLW